MNNPSQRTQQESGADLFARLISQKKNSDKISTQTDPKLSQLENILMINKTLNIDSNILSNGINNKEIVEIYGKVGVGKTELIMHLISRCIIPKKWCINLNKHDQNITLSSQSQVEDISIDLSNYSCLEDNQILKVILIDTDLKFNTFRLYTIIENRIESSLNKFLNNQTNKEEILTKFQSNNKVNRLKQRFIRECLKNLTIYQCYNSEQFILALCACEHYIQSLIANNLVKTSITPIFIDSINSNFEIFDKYNNNLGLSEYDHTEKFSIQLIKKLIDRYNICLLATRTDFRFLSTDSSFSCFKKWQLLLNKQIELINKDLRVDIEEKDQAQDKEENVIIKSRKISILKLTEFLKDKENSFKILKDNVKYSIENFGFNI